MEQPKMRRKKTLKLLFSAKMEGTEKSKEKFEFPSMAPNVKYSRSELQDKIIQLIMQEKEMYLVSNFTTKEMLCILENVFREGGEFTDVARQRFYMEFPNAPDPEPVAVREFLHRFQETESRKRLEDYEKVLTSHVSIPVGETQQMSLGQLEHGLEDYEKALTLEELEHGLEDYQKALNLLELEHESQDILEEKDNGASSSNEEDRQKLLQHLKYLRHLEDLRDSKRRQQLELKGSSVQIRHPKGRAALQCISVDQSAYLHCHKAFKVIGKAGGVIYLKECKISIPKNSLKEDVKFEAMVLYGSESEESTRYSHHNMQLTPLLMVKPHGFQFEKEAEITLPTCYRTSCEMQIKIVKKSGDTEDFYTHEILTMKPQSTSFKFSTKELSWYSAIPQKIQQFLGLQKEMALILAVPPGSCETPTQIVASLIICDNVASAKDLKNLNQLIETTFLVTREDQDLIANLASDEIEFDPHEVSVDEIWNSTRNENPFMLKDRQENGLGDKKFDIEIKSAQRQKVMVTKLIYVKKECLVIHEATRYDIRTETVNL